MRRLLVTVLLLIAIAPVRAEAPLSTEAPIVELVLFYGEGCPHCAALHQFLDAIGPKYPALQIRAYEVYGNAGNARLFERVAAAYGVSAEAVPTLFLGDSVIVGFSADSEPELEQKIKLCVELHCASPLQHRGGGEGRPRQAKLIYLVAGAIVLALGGAVLTLVKIGRR